MVREECVDLHVHTDESFDSSLTIADVIKAAKENNVSMVAISNHNTGVDFASYCKARRQDLNNPIWDIEGIRFIPAIEVTCRMDSVKNKAGNTAKVHLLVYGADMSEDSPINILLKYKRSNDRGCDLGLLDHIHQLRGTNLISEDKIREFMREKRSVISGFSSLSRDSVWELFNKHGITIAKSYQQFCQMVASAPYYERLNISAEDFIKIAHASGGLVVMAHPWVNLKRIDEKGKAVDKLIQCGIDGFELFSNTTTDEIMMLIKDHVRKAKPKNKIFYTGGSDSHDFSRGNQIGRINYQPIPRLAVKDFENEIIKLYAARIDGELTYRKYNPVTQDEINYLLDYYREEYEYLKSSAECIGELRSLAVKRPKKERKEKAKDKTKKPKRIRAEKKEELNGTRYDIEDFESIHAYPEAINSDSIEPMFEKDDEDKQIYADYLKKMEKDHSKNISELLEDYEYKN